MRTTPHVLFRVPLYCLIVGWLAYQLNTRFLLGFFIGLFPEDSTLTYEMAVLILSGITFFICFFLGGFVFFHNMTKKELLFSASIMVIINVLWGFMAYNSQDTIALIYSQVNEWRSFVSWLLLYYTDLNHFISGIIGWLTPLLFVLFGKTIVKKKKQPDIQDEYMSQQNQ